MLVSQRHETRFVETLSEELDILVADEKLLEEIVGFHFHRGILACGVRRKSLSLDELVKGFSDEALKGAWSGFRSSRLNKQWRLIYQIEGNIKKWQYLPQIIMPKHASGTNSL